MERERAKLVLYVEDDPDHADLVLRTLERLRLDCRILHLADGEAALDYLLRSRSQQAERPYLVLLDLRLPKVDGFELLRSIKSDALLRGIPVVVLTTSASESDVARAYQQHVNGYVVKPDDLPALDDLLRELGAYWLGWNLQPSVQPSAPALES